MKDITMKYSNGEVTIVWKPSLCRHSAICWKGPEGLISVFNPTRKPPTERIIEQVMKCPSGALNFYLNSDEQMRSHNHNDPKGEE
jgi:uncharacterized Fe-S cluster protein YjdI